MIKLSGQQIVFLIFRGMEQMVARRAHNPKVVGSSPAPATSQKPCKLKRLQGFIFALCLILCVRTEKKLPLKKSNFFLWIFSEKFFYSAEARTTQSHANIFGKNDHRIVCTRINICAINLIECICY